MLFIHIPAAWLLADAMSGLVHWVMDKRLRVHGEPDTFLQFVAADNELHHTNPGSIAKFTILQNMGSSLTAAPISFCLWATGAPTFLWLAFTFLLFGNVVHRWAHAPLAETPRIVQLLQRLGIFQSKQHHFQHHYTMGRRNARAQSSRRYCVMSNFINPLLEWRQK